MSNSTFRKISTIYQQNFTKYIDAKIRRDQVKGAEESRPRRRPPVHIGEGQGEFIPHYV